MAIVKRSASVNEALPEKRFKEPKTAKLDVTLPTKPSKVRTDLSGFSILLHGEKKIGKTGMMAQEPDALFLEFDPEQPYAIMQRQIPDWRYYLAYLNALEKHSNGDFPYRSLIVDRLDLMYLRCFKFCCKDLGITHPTDLGYGKGWDRIKQEFAEGVERLMHLPAKSRWIAHSTWKEIETHDGDNTEKLMPELSKQADAMFTGLVDINMAFCFSGKKRLLVVMGSETVSAGHRVPGKFVTPDGRAVEEIYAGSGPEETYANFVRAFNNEQTYTTLDERTEQVQKRKRQKAGKEKV